MLAWRINAAGLLARLAPAGFFVASAFAVLAYALRRSESPLAAAWAVLGLGLVGAAVLSWWRARRGFFTTDDARVLLESHWQLDTRLTAAQLGLVAWPPVPALLRPVLAWQLQVPAGWLAGAIALIAGAILAPIPGDARPGRGAGPPPALVQTEGMLAALKEMNIADPPAIEQLQERAGELARRPAEEQYSHSALEAADALRHQTVAAAAGLARGLDDAASALRAANNGADMNGPAGQLSAALSGLRDGALPANKDLLANLPGSAMDLKNLTAEQRADLAGQLAEAANGLAGIGGAAGAGARVARPDPNAPQGEGSGFGAGGSGGGGDTGPLTLSPQPSDAGDGRSEALSGDAFKRFSLGDKLGTTNSAHEVDPKQAQTPGAAGAVAAPASGGEAAWVNRLTPAERAALKTFFK